MINNNEMLKNKKEIWIKQTKCSQFHSFVLNYGNISLLGRQNSEYSRMLCVRAQTFMIIIINLLVVFLFWNVRIHGYNRHHKNSSTSAAVAFPFFDLNIYFFHLKHVNFHSVSAFLLFSIYIKTILSLVFHVWCFDFHMSSSSSFFFYS